MNINDFKVATIEKLIAHTIHPKTKETDAYCEPANSLLGFNQEENAILVKRLEDALKNSKKTFKLEFEDKADKSVFGLLTNGKVESNFVETSKLLSDRLADAHFRINIPGGFSLVGEGKTTNGEYFFFIIKAELQEVFNIDDHNNLKLIKDVFLSPARDFYKIGVFIKEGRTFTPYMFDDQFSLQKKDLTEYFYSQFLGLTTDKNDSLKSKNFFSDVKDFIEVNVDNVKDRLGLLKALQVTYREDTSGLLSPADFSENYFEGTLKKKLDKIIQTKYPLSFTRNLSLIENRLELTRLSIPLSYSLNIIGSSSALDDLEIITDPDNHTVEDLKVSINNGMVRQLVIVKEK